MAMLVENPQRHQIPAVPRILGCVIGAALIAVAIIAVANTSDPDRSHHNSVATALDIVNPVFGAPAPEAQPQPSIYDGPQRTEHGCTCTSACTMSASLDCSSGAICQVDQSTCTNGSPMSWGMFLPTYYDHCVYPAYTPYESKTATQKNALLLDEITADTTPGEYSLKITAAVMQESVRVSQEATSDVFPDPKRLKAIHSVGTHVPVSYTSVGNHGYTGIFASGADHGFIRLSSAVPPTSGSPEAGEEPNGSAPGAGIKLLRDGVESANFVTMPSIYNTKCSADSTSPDDGYFGDFFERPFYDHLSSSSLRKVYKNKDAKITLVSKFAQSSTCPARQGKSNMAKYDQFGKEVPDEMLSFPYGITLRSSEGFKSSANFACDGISAYGSMTGDGNEKYKASLKTFATIPVGTRFWDVYAIASPEDCSSEPGSEDTCTETLIGYFTTTGEFTTSNFGDTRLFFKHQAAEEDFALRPQWMGPSVGPYMCTTWCPGNTRPAAAQGCSYMNPTTALTGWGPGVTAQSNQNKLFGAATGPRPGGTCPFKY